MFGKINHLIFFGFVCLATCCLVIYCLWRYALTLVLSLIFIVLMQVVVSKIECFVGYGKFKRVCICIVVYVVFLGMFIGLFVLVVFLCKQFIPLLLYYIDNFLSEGHFTSLYRYVEPFKTVLEENVHSIVMTFSSVSIAVVKVIPTLLFEGFVFILISLIGLINYYAMKDYLLMKFHTLYNVLRVIVYSIRKACFGLCKVFIVMFLVHFMFLSFCFFIMRLEHYFFTAFIISIFGVDIPMLLWIVYSFLMGDVVRAGFIVFVYFFAVIIKQVVEPRFIAKQSIVHPIAMIILAYLAFKISGIVGVFLSYVGILFMTHVYYCVKK